MLGLNPDPFAWICVGALLVQGLIRAPYAKARRANTFSADHYKADEKLLIFLVFVGMFLIPVLNLFVRALDRFDWALQANIHLVLGIAGITVMAFALWLFWRSHDDLGRNWSPSLQIRDEHTLVTGGVYARMRHPMYAAIWLIGVAQALLLQNWITGLASLVLFLPMHLIRIPREERMLREQFGEAWDRFAAKRGRVFPRL